MPRSSTLAVAALSSALFIGVAAAQTPSWPIINGRHLQLTQQQVDSKEDDRSREWNRGVGPEIDRNAPKPDADFLSSTDTFPALGGASGGAQRSEVTGK